MNTTKTIRNSPLPPFASAGKSAYSLLIPLPVLGLCLAAAAWSQLPPGVPPPLSSNSPGGRQSALATPDVRNGRQRAHLPTAASVAIPAAQSTAAIPAFAPYSFVNINIPNSTYVQPNGVNNSGLVTGYYTDASYNTHGFTWQNGTVQTLDYPAASATYLNGTNNYGLLIGYYVDSSGNPHSVTYSTVKSAWTVLPDIPEYTQGAQGSGINDDGIAVGYSLGYPFGTLSWIWCPNSQSYSFFTAPAAAEASTYPSGINHKMQLVGYAYTVPGSSYYPLGFLRRDDEEYETLNVPGSVGTFAVAINDSGTIAGWFETETTYFGFVQAGRGAVTAVNYPGYAGTFVDGINDFGTVCGNSYTASYAVQAFVAFPL